MTQVNFSLKLAIMQYNFDINERYKSEIHGSPSFHKASDKTGRNFARTQIRINHLECFVLGLE